MSFLDNELSEPLHTRDALADGPENENYHDGVKFRSIQPTACSTSPRASNR
jgi:hypothetical protein